MLQRIQQIKNIGAFTDCQAANVPFKKWTVIYGRNTYGKSTLADILSSLRHNDPLPIVDRATIPGDNSGQQIKISFAAQGENETQGIAHFRGGAWQPGLRESHRLQIYDETFYYTNLFSSRTFSRDTKTNFSAFVLGEAGVSKAKVIAEKRKRKRAVALEISKLGKAAFSNVRDIEKFLKLEVEEKKEDLEADREKLRERYSELKRQQKNTTSILSRREPRTLSFIDGVVDTISELNSALQVTLDVAHRDAKEKVNNHIQKNMGSSDNSLSWIRTGLSFSNGDNCQFCGQVLSDDSVALLEAYRKYFDDSFERLISDLTRRLDACISKLRIDVYQPVILRLEENSSSLKSYPELEYVLDSGSIGKSHWGLKDEIQDIVRAFSAEKEKLLQQCVQKVERKRAELKSPIEPVDYSGIESAILDIRALLKRYDESVVTPAVQEIKQFKKTLDPEVIERSIKDTVIAGESVSEKILRINKKESCDDYIELRKEQDEIEKSLPKLTSELEAEQSDYIKQFFETINEHFKAFGSDNFVLERALSSSGHEPIYFIKVLYKGQEISEKKLDKVFSESDRRALSLAVFWAGLEKTPPDELKRTVVVLDDPVTSFDDHRITNTYSRMAMMAPRVEQLILLSHYREGVSRLLGTYGHSQSIQLLELEKNDVSSKFKESDPVSFCKSVHEQKRDVIFSFVERKTDLFNVQLRVFLEEEINLRFAKQLRDLGVTEAKLSEKINCLRDADAISVEIQGALHDWRESLNPEHHTWVGDDIEDKRGAARRFIDFLYHELKAEPATV